MTDSDYIDSYYRDTLANQDLFLSPDGDCEVEVCVVGGGLAGLTAARELVQLGKSVALLEAKRIGWGASGRNGGFVSDGYAEGILALEKRLGFGHAKALFDLSCMGTDYVRRAIRDLNPPGVPVQAGWLRVLRHEDEEDLRHRTERMNEAYGAAYTFWPKEKVRHRLRSERYFQGMNDTRAFHIQPLNYARALAHDVVAKGGQVFEAAEARSLARDGKGWSVVLTKGQKIRCRAVLLCGSAYMKALYPKLERAVLPVATYVAVSEPMREALAAAIQYSGCISDARRAGDYYRLVDGGDRLLWGGRMTTRRSDPARLASMLKRDIGTVFPQLGDFKLVRAWSGLMGYCIHKMPILGELEPGLWAATATGGHGLNTTATIGVLAAEGIVGRGDRHRLFQPFGAQWGGGPIGRTGAQLTYWKLQIQDWWEESKGRGS